MYVLPLLAKDSESRERMLFSLTSRSHDNEIMIVTGIFRLQKKKLIEAFFLWISVARKQILDNYSNLLIVVFITFILKIKAVCSVACYLGSYSVFIYIQLNPDNSHN